VAGDRRVQLRGPTPRMVRSSGSPLSQQALAQPYQDARSQHRPMSARAPTHNVDCPGNSLHSGEPFAEGPHLRGAVRVRPQPRGPHSQQLQANMVHFGYRTLRCPKLLQPSGFPASELSSATLSPRMVRSSGSPLSQQALAQPYQDARSTIDRGSSLDTVIGAGSRLDNLVQIGHNVILGRCCVIVAQVGISGSTVLEDFVRVGGQAAMAGHLRIGQGAGIGAQAGVMSDLVPGAEVLGSPAQPKRDFFRQIVMLKRMAKGEG